LVKRRKRVEKGYEVKMKKIIDISQEVFSCKVFPGDPAPKNTQLLSVTKGDVCNLTQLSMCAHNGTHVDAPFHFLNDGKTIDQLGLVPFVGDCFVARYDGNVTAADAAGIMEKAKSAGAAERILIAGKATVTAEAARVFAAAGIKLLGNESQTVGPEDAPKEVHLILLGAEVVLLEGIVLDNVDEGRYILSAAPLNLGGCDGAPCRAYLIK
jgi:arylformamidase